MVMLLLVMYFASICFIFVFITPKIDFLSPGPIIKQEIWTERWKHGAQSELCPFNRGQTVMFVVYHLWLVWLSQLFKVIGAWW